MAAFFKDAGKAGPVVVLKSCRPTVRGVPGFDVAEFQARCSRGTSARRRDMDGDGALWFERVEPLHGLSSVPAGIMVHAEKQVSTT